MAHKNFYEIAVKDTYALGLAKGELFGDVARRTLEVKRQGKNWREKIELSKDYLSITQQHFPDYMKELQGYAKASGISFEEFWVISLEDDFDYVDAEKCTTIVTNKGMLVSHNEDWDVGAQDIICVLKKTVGTITTIELFYYNTLGGASACINSYGYAMLINTLTHTDRQTGVPRNVIARWLSETNDVKRDFERLKHIPRSLGYNHLFVHAKGDVWDIECSAKKETLIRPVLPYVHTNHYLSEELRFLEENNRSSGTYERYDSACKIIKENMTVDELVKVTDTASDQGKDGIMNERTIGKMIIDFKESIVKIWLKRENNLGWIDYKLDFIV